MIIKTYQLEKIKKNQSNFYLLYGENEGYKNEVIDDVLTINFKDKINRYEETDIINNFDNFVSEYFNIYNEYPNQISFLSFDLVGLVYFLIYKNDFIINNKIFYKKNKFKGKIGIFEINKNKISHILNFYVAEDNNFRKIF